MIVNLLEKRKLNNGRLFLQTKHQETGTKGEKERERNCPGLLLKGAMTMVLGR
jgi:hypothetical protein